jgi:hypothetical protein
MLSNNKLQQNNGTQGRRDTTNNRKEEQNGAIDWLAAARAERPSEPGEQDLNTKHKRNQGSSEETQKDRTSTMHT